MREVGIVSFAQSDCRVNRQHDMAEILAPVIRDALASARIERSDVDFFVSGSHDFHEGRTFSYIESLDAVGAWPPISESHVEMDAAWALYEAWAWLQLGHGDIALVYGIGRGTLPVDLDQVAPSMLDPYFLTPLRPHRHALAGLQARALLNAGILSEEHSAATVARCLAAAQHNPHALRSGEHRVADLLAQPYVASPLRDLDIAPVGDAAAVMILAAGDRARALSEAPVWIRAIDHRLDTHYPGNRDLTTSATVRRAGQRAAELAGFGAESVDVAELHAEYSYVEPLLAAELGLRGDVVLNPSGGPLAGAPTTATGLIRVGEAARRIAAGQAQRALAHATSGPALQQNLICLLEGER
ncbi:lipid-transfer protein [Nocardioides sp.]|uniref:lipid-transfer protein n=1 Tax=Nocardioides sp. TaxID=35761 RepID=UPI002601E358|nr:lipid-transfer protein [Nocardioides sp.]